MSANANYRKLNDHSCNSSTYHKKDGTAVRAKLKQRDESPPLWAHAGKHGWIDLNDAAMQISILDVSEDAQGCDVYTFTINGEPMEYSSRAYAGGSRPGV
jgi:hypothetical protein